MFQVAKDRLKVEADYIHVMVQLDITHILVMSSPLLYVCTKAKPAAHELWYLWLLITVTSADGFILTARVLYAACSVYAATHAFIHGNTLLHYIFFCADKKKENHTVCCV